MMLWNDHSKLKGQHAFLGASNNSWINWNDDTLAQRYYGQYAQSIGTAIHTLAEDCIRNRIKLTKSDKHLIDLVMFREGIPKNSYDADIILENLVPYIYDAIGFHMEPEIILYYSKNCFGTTDAIYFSEKEKILRIHDLKTGVTSVKIEQLMVYAALFCLEYHVKPKDIYIELRIYQNSEVLCHKPTAEEIEKIMDIIRDKDKFIAEYVERSIK